MKIVKQHNELVRKIEVLNRQLIALQPEIMLTFESLNDIEKIAMVESMSESECTLELYLEMEDYLKEAIEKGKT